MIVLAAYGIACSKGSDQPSVAAKSTTETGSATVPATAAGRQRVDSSASGGHAKMSLVFAGTSITAGLGLEPDSAYPMLIQRKIDSAGLPFEVTNAGVSGETSAGLIDRLDWLLRGDFKVLVVETGANDGLRGVPTATLKQNLETALDRIKAKRPDAKLVVVQMEALPNLGPKYASDFHRIYGDVTKEKGVTLVPFLLDSVAGRRDLNQGDGVHPNNRGERIVADNVWRSLRPVLDSVARTR
ncbi:MAG TPA: arylesterase [Gemmatimonadaceae bacterium]